MACSIVERMKRRLDNIEIGKWSDLTLQQCVDKIDWLARWKKVPEEVWVPLCTKCTELLDSETRYLKMKR